MFEGGAHFFFIAFVVAAGWYLGQMAVVSFNNVAQRIEYHIRKHAWERAKEAEERRLENLSPEERRAAMAAVPDEVEPPGSYL